MPQNLFSTKQNIRGNIGATSSVNFLYFRSNFVFFLNYNNRISRNLESRNSEKRFKFKSYIVEQNGNYINYYWI